MCCTCIYARKLQYFCCVVLDLAHCFAMLRKHDAGVLRNFVKQGDVSKSQLVNELIQVSPLSIVQSRKLRTQLYEVKIASTHMSWLDLRWRCEAPAWQRRIS